MRKYTGLFFTAALLTLHSCEIKQQHTKTDEPTPEYADSVETKQEPTVDTFITQRYDLKRVYKTITCKISIEYPTNANETFTKNFCEYLNESMGGQYTGTYNDIRGLLGFYANRFLNEQKENYIEDERLELETNFDYTKTYETPTFVTFNKTTYIYSGGAHGMGVQEGITFRKNDGKKLGWDLLTNTGDPEFKQLIINGLKSYLAENSEDNKKNITDEELIGMLLGIDYIEDIPLPKNPPVFTPKGMMLSYVPYEITAYCFGQPSLTIPYETSKKYLKSTALEMLKE